LLLNEPCALELPETYAVTDLESIKENTPDQITSLLRENPERLAVFLLNALKRGQNPPYVNQKSYFCGSRTDIPDCVESTIRNFFDFILFDGNKYNSDLLPETISRNLNPKLTEFYRRFPLEETLSDEAGQAWFLLLASLHEKDPSIRYTEETCELYGDEENITKVINALFDIEASCFSDFASLLSTAERQIDIDAKSSTEYLLNVKKEDRSCEFLFSSVHAQCKFVTIEDPSLTAIFNSILREQTPLSLVVLSLDPSILFTGHYFDDRNYLSLGRNLSNPNVLVNIIESITQILAPENPDSENYCSWINSLLDELEKMDEYLYEEGLSVLMKAYDSIAICARKLIDQRKESPQGLLFVAAGHGSSKSFIDHVIANGAKVDEKSEYGESALMVAASNDNYDTVIALIEKGATVDERNGYGRTALMLAASVGHTEMVQLLIDKRAPIYATDDYGCTALMLSAEGGCTETVQVLIDKGADIYATDRSGVTALMYAADEGHAETVNMLINKGAKVDARNEDGGTALMQAARNGHAEVVKLLINRGAKVDATDAEGYTVLMYAKQSWYPDIVEILAEAIEGAKKAAPTV